MAAAAPAGAPFAALLASSELSLSERDLSPRYLEVCRRTGTQFAAYLTQHGLPADTEAIGSPHIRAFLAAGTAPSAA
jgi:hypothetical protein